MVHAATRTPRNAGRLTGGKLGGEVEVDETFIGGKARNMHKNDRRRKNLRAAVARVKQSCSES